jgi:signal transduction histidine kinase/CheY-like chemotaxis protein/streptogramin lyase
MMNGWDNQQMPKKFLSKKFYMIGETITETLMNTLPKSLAIAILAVSIFILVLTADFTGAQDTVAAETAPDLPRAEIPLSQYLRFSKFTSRDGLSSNQTRNVIQDKRGFMWFGTIAGLNRYDGTSLKVYRHDPDDSNSISNNVARVMIVDQSGTLWVGTWGGGLNQYDAEKDAFICYKNDPDNPQSLSANIVRMLYEDRNGTIWIGTMAGLNKLDRDSGQFIRYSHDPDDPSSLSHNVIWSIVEDSIGVLWVGTEDGLNRFDPKTETFVHYRHDPDAPVSLSHNTIRSIYEDRSGMLWVGTENGLDKLNPERTRITRYQHDANDPQTLSHNIINSVVEDRAGNLWVGTWGGGLNRFDQETETFINYRHSTDDPYSLSSDSIWHIYEGQQGMLLIATEGGISILDGTAKPFHHYRTIPNISSTLSNNRVSSLYIGRAGIVWIGTDGGGLNKFDSQTEKFTHFLHDPSDPINLSNDNLTAVYEDRSGIIWIGTRGKGLIKYDQDAEGIISYRYDNTNTQSLSHDSVVIIHEDRTGTLWIGTYGGGLNAFDRETEQFTRYQHDPADPHALSNNVVLSVLEDRAGTLWIGTMGGGLNKFNRKTEEFTHYKHDPSDPNTLSNDSVMSIYEDRTGTLWIGTSGGLNKFDRQNDRFTIYTAKYELSVDNICGILEDERGLLWFSTPKGLSRFDPKKESFRNYTVNDGLQSNTFSIYSPPSKSRSGEMFFGGTNGFNAFYPDQIVDNLTPPPVVITDFQLANQSVPIGGESVLQKSILEADELVLSFQDNVFSFEFVALNYRAPEENRYKYKMEGFDNEWIETVSTRRFATYTNLDPGEYVFRAIASNNDGVWNEEGASIRITVTPPWWETLWFRISMAVAALGLLAGGFQWRISAIEARSRELEIQVVERTHELTEAKEDAEEANRESTEAKENAEEANRAKSTFLANMSHELRTPLHAILGFARLLTRNSGLDKGQQESLDIINRSGEHLLGMIDDILSLSRIEAGRIELKPVPFDVTQMLQDVGQMMKSRAEGKGLRFTLELDSALPPYMQGDVGKLRQILINLLGNAVKFTEKGDVWLRARSQPMADDPDRVMLQFEVQDSGIGIPQDRLDGVFESFVRLEQAQNKEKGTGLGLVISKSLVDMMKGEIKIESEPDKGSLFKVSIPFQMAEGEDGIPIKAPVKKVIGLQADQPKWRILVVDDNLENRVLLTTILTNIGCKVKEANNGEEAIKIFQEWHPHFIWMDMRMPIMDGFEATRKLRTLPGGKAVRIVAATASVLEERHGEILACGCDEVVRKPFKGYEIFESMARQLGMKYLYKDRGAEATHKQGINLTAEMLAELPPELLQELRETTRALNREAISEVIERIQEHEPDTAEGLRVLVQDFQMGRLGELLGEVKSEKME